MTMYLFYQVQSNQNIRNHESVQASLKTQIRDLQRDVSDKANSLQRKVKEIDEVKEMMAMKLGATERKYQDEIVMYQR